MSRAKAKRATLAVVPKPHVLHNGKMVSPDEIIHSAIALYAAVRQLESFMDPHRAALASKILDGATRQLGHIIAACSPSSLDVEDAFNAEQAVQS